MATYLLNILPTKTLKFSTPHLSLFGSAPSYDHLRVFSSAAPDAPPAPGTASSLPYVAGPPLAAAPSCLSAADVVPPTAVAAPLAGPAPCRSHPAARPTRMAICRLQLAPSRPRLAHRWPRTARRGA
jgi:hypothetical protein